MGTHNVSIDQVADAIAESLQELNADVAEDVKDAVDGVSKGLVRELKKTSPKNTGSYASGWTRKKTAEDAYAVSYTIHNKKKPGLTHLLEKGHALRSGGRVEGQPHIDPAYKRAEAELIERIEEAIEEG